MGSCEFRLTQEEAQEYLHDKRRWGRSTRVIAFSFKKGTPLEKANICRLMMDDPLDFGGVIYCFPEKEAHECEIAKTYQGTKQA